MILPAALDKRFPVPSKAKEQNEAVANARKINPTKGEKRAEYNGCIRSLLNKSAKAKVDYYPDNIRADMLLDSLGTPLGSPARISILGLAQGKLEFESVATALEEVH